MISGAEVLRCVGSEFGEYSGMDSEILGKARKWTRVMGNRGNTRI